MYSFRPSGSPVLGTWSPQALEHLYDIKSSQDIPMSDQYCVPYEPTSISTPGFSTGSSPDSCTGETLEECTLKKCEFQPSSAQGSVASSYPTGITVPLQTDVDVQADAAEHDLQPSRLSQAKFLHMTTKYARGREYNGPNAYLTLTANRSAFRTYIYKPIPEANGVESEAARLFLNRQELKLTLDAPIRMGVCGTKSQETRRIIAEVDCGVPEEMTVSAVLEKTVAGTGNATGDYSIQSMTVLPWGPKAWKMADKARKERLKLEIAARARLEGSGTTSPAK
jgi:hypothetical protein